MKRQWDRLTDVIANWMDGSSRANEFYNGEKRNPQCTAAVAARQSVMPRVLAFLLIATAILMLTFVAATTLVKGFSAKGNTRLTHVTVEQQASAEYRKARARCQQLASSAREACIAEAHAAEERSRAVALVTQRDYMSRLRSQTDAAIDAGDKDNIIVEPACNIVARGQGSLCEIQVKPTDIGRVAGTNLIPAKVTAAQFAALYPPRPARVQAPRPVEVFTYPVSRPAAPSPAQVEDRIFHLAWSSRN